MRIINIIPIVCICISLCPTHFAQQYNIDNISITKSDNISKDLLFSLVVLEDKYGDYRTGFLVGYKTDTLVILENEQNLKIAINDLNSISLEAKGKGSIKGVTIGAIMGTYLFFLAFWQAEDEPFAYWQDDSPAGQALLSLLGTFVGAGIGYLVDGFGQGKKELFDLRGDENTRKAEVIRLKKFLTGMSSEPKVHLGFRLGQVNTRFSELGNENYYSHRDLTSFNLLRRLQLTYSIFNDLEIGAAVNWFGEPGLYWYDFIGDAYGEQQYIGYGFYALVNYQPLKSILGSTVGWRIGGGIGIGNVDYSFVMMENYYPYTGTGADTTIVEIEQTMFSSLIFTELDIYLYDEFSLGMYVDYIYLPEDMNDIPKLSVDKRNLGNFSFGISMDLHF